MTTDPRRRATDGSEPSNAELLDRINAIGTRMDGWIAEHRRDHTAVDSRCVAHDVAAALRDRRIDELSALTIEVRALHDFRIKWESYGTMLKLLLGTSVLGTLLSMLTLIGYIQSAKP